MKRLWFAVVFIALCLLACAYEQYVVKSAYEDIVSVIDQAIETQSADEKEAYCREITDKWDYYYKMVSLITDHSILQSADISIGTINALAQNGSESIDEVLTETKGELKQIYESSRINLSNIF